MTGELNEEGERVDIGIESEEFIVTKLVDVEVVEGKLRVGREGVVTGDELPVKKESAELSTGEEEEGNEFSDGEINSSAR